MPSYYQWACQKPFFLLCIDINPMMNYTHQHHKCFVVVIHPHTPHVFNPNERQNEMMQIAV